MGKDSLTGCLGVGIGRYGKFSSLSFYMTLITKTLRFPFARPMLQVYRLFRSCQSRCFQDQFSLNSFMFLDMSKLVST